MPATVIEATDDILTMFKTAWDTITPVVPEVIYPATEQRDLFSGDNSFAQIQLTHTRRSVATLANHGNKRRYKAEGVFVVNIHVPLKGNDVLTTAQNLGKIVTDAFENIRSPNGVDFFNVTGEEIGNLDRFYLLTVSMNFEYTEIR